MREQRLWAALGGVCAGGFSRDDGHVEVGAQRLDVFAHHAELVGAPRRDGGGEAKVSTIKDLRFTEGTRLASVALMPRPERASCRAESRPNGSPGGEPHSRPLRPGKP